MKVTYWSDYACPFCYIGETNLKKALEEACPGEDNSFEMKAFELHPEAPKEGTAMTLAEAAAKRGTTPDAIMQRLSGIMTMAKEAGLDYKYEKMLSCNTVDAHRLTKFAAEKKPELSEAMTERLYKAYFIEQQLVSDHQILADLAAEVGFDKAEVLEFLATDKYEMDVKLDEREAYRYGISSVPCFVFENLYAVNGAMSKDQFVEIIGQIKEEMARRQTEELMKNAQANAGVVCGPDGCEPVE